MDNEKREFENTEIENSVIEEISEPILENEVSEKVGQANLENEIETEELDVYNETIEENILSDEELQLIKEEKKRKTKKVFCVSAIVIAVLFVVGLIYSLCVINSVGSKTIVNTSLPAKYSAQGEKLEEKKFDVKFENPFISLLSLKNTSVLKVNGYGIGEDEFNYFLKGSSLDYQYGLFNNKIVTDFNDFDWNEINEETSLKNSEIAKGEAVKSVSTILAVIAEAEKRGITLTEDEEKSITDWAQQIKDSYGENLDNALKQSGYESIEQLIKIQKMQTLYQKAYEAFNEEPMSYVKQFKDYEKVLTKDKVSVRHVLVEFPDGITRDSTDEEKAETRKEAEEVLKKAKSGENFDELVFEHNDDQGQGKYGYTFANDGSMVQEFADASFALKIDEVSDIVETDFGYHIIKRTERIPVYEEYIELLEKNMKIRINKFAYSNIVVDANLSEYMGEEVVGDNTATENKQSEKSAE